MVQSKNRRLVTESALELFIDTQAASPVATLAELPAANSGNRGLIRFVTSENEPYYSNGTTWSSISQGAQGVPGPAGAGVPSGGEPLQIIRKNSVGTTTEWVTPTKTVVGLSNVDNTSDMNKPVSTMQKLALDEKLDAAKLPDEVDGVNKNLIENSASLTNSALNTFIEYKVKPRAHLVIGSASATTDRATLQAAVNEASAAGAPLQVRGSFQLTGGTITPMGAVDIDARNSEITQLDSLRTVFSLKSDSRYVGGKLNGKGTDWVNTSAVYAAAAFQIGTAASNVTIEGVDADNFAGAGVYAPAPGPGLRVINPKFRGVGSGIIPASIGQWGGGIVANDMEDFAVIGGTMSGFAQGMVIGESDRFYIGGGIELSSVGQHGIYLGNAKSGSISGVRVVDVPLQGIKSQISDSTPNDSDLFTIGDVSVRGNGSHAILLTNTQATDTGRHRRVSIHDLNVNHAGEGDTVNLQNVTGASVHDIQSRGGNSGLRFTNCSRLNVHDMGFADALGNGVTSVNSTDIDFSNIRITDGSTLSDPTRRFGFYILGALSARIRFMHNIVEDSAARMQYAFYLAGGDIASMDFAHNKSRGMSEYGYRGHQTVSTGMWMGNDLQGSMGRFFNTPPNAANVVDTTGATLLALEAEVNKIKQRLRDFKAYNV